MPGSSGSKWRRWRRLAIALGAVLAVLLALYVVLRILTSPARVARLVHQRLVEEVGGDVQVGRAEFHLLSGITVRDVELREEPDAAPWASVRELFLRHHLAPLLYGRLELASVRVVEPKLVVTDTSCAVLSRLREEPRREAAFPPAVVVERGEVRLEPCKALPRIQPLTLGPITVGLTNADERGKLLTLTGELDTPAGAVALDAHIDTTRSTARLRAVASAVALDKLPRDWLPQALRTRRELQELTGVLSGDLDGSASWAGQEPQVAYVARLRFDDVSFQPQDVALPVKGASGEAVVRPGRVALADVFGRVGQARFELEDLQLAFLPGGGRSVSFSGSLYDLPLDSALRAALPKRAQDTWDALGVQGGRADVQARGSLHSGGELALDAELRDLRFQPRDTAYPLPPLAGRARYDSSRALVVLDDIEGEDERLSLEVSGTVHAAAKRPTFRLRVRADGVPLDQRLRDALGQRLAATWKQLGIEGGTVDADLQAAGGKADEARLAGILDVYDVRVRPEAFPYPLPPLAGRIRLTANRQVHITELAGSLGDLSLRATGTVNAGVDDPVLRLRIGLTGLPVDDALREAVPKDARDALAKADLRDGTIDAEIALHGSTKEPKLAAQVTLDGCSAQLASFPYRIDGLRGVLGWDGKAKLLVLRGVSGSHGRARLTLDGQVDLSEAEKPKLGLAVEATGVALDRDLRAALPKEWHERWQRHQPSGTVDARLRLATDPSGALIPRGTVELRECGLAVPELPRRLVDVSGTVKLGARAAELDNVAARMGPTQLRADAVYRTDGDTGRLESLSLTAIELELDDALLPALPAKLRDALKPHAPAGPLDLRLDYADDGKEPPRTRASALLRGLAVTVRPEGPRLAQLRGDVRSDGRTLTFAGVRGRLGSAAVELDGRLALGPEGGETAVQVRLPSFQLTPAFLRELPEEHRASLERLAPRGGVQAAATIRSPEPQATATVTAATVAFEDLALGTEPRVDRLYGTARYVAQPKPGEPEAARVTLSIARARIAGLALQDLTATCLASRKALDVSDVDWSLYGGRVTGKVRVSAGESPTYAGEAAIAHLDLESLVAAFGDVKNAPSGWLRGTVRLQGKGTELAGLTLEGACKIDRGHLYDLPLVVSVWNVLALQLPGKGALTDAHVEFRIRDAVLHIDHFLLTGQASPLDVKGTMELKPGVRLTDQKIDLLFTVARQRGLLDKLPVVGWVKAQSYDRLRRYFLQARVTGTVTDYRVEYLARPIVEPIGEFWSLLGRVATEAAGAVTPRSGTAREPDKR